VESRQFHLHNGKKGAALAVRVIPRASKNEIAEVLNEGTVKVRLTVAANDATLNKVLIEFLAETLAIPHSRLDIVAGLNGLDKLITILDLDAATVQERILKQMS
jgi:uncharacterized protein